MLDRDEWQVPTDVDDPILVRWGRLLFLYKPAVLLDERLTMLLRRLAPQRIVGFGRPGFRKGLRRLARLDLFVQGPPP